MKKTITTFLKNTKCNLLFSLILICNITYAQIPGSIDLAFGKPVLAVGDSSRFDDEVRAILVQPDGNAVVGGKFTHYNGTSNICNRIARLTPDGNIDASFAVTQGFSAFSQVNALARQSNDGKILAGGTFSTYNGITCGKIARIKFDGSADVPFLLNIGTGFNNDVYTIAVQSDGKIIVGGHFTMFKTTSCNYIVRLDSTGLLYPTFNIGKGFNSDVNSILIQPDGKIIVGGYFTSYGSTPSVGHICRLNTDGTIDNSFYINSGSGFNTTVMALAIQPADGKIIVGGNFNSYNSSTINKVARLDSTGLLDGSFSTGSIFSTVNYFVNALVLQSNGNIVVGGASGLVQGGIACLNPNGTLNSSFLSYYGGFSFANTPNIYTIANEPNGNILCGGKFDTYNNTRRNRIARLTFNGWLSDTYTVSTGFDFGFLYKIAIQPDGKILVGGYNCNNYNGTYVNNLARLMSQDGVNDTSFHHNLNQSFSIEEIVYDTIHNKIIIGGSNILRLNIDGTPDPLFFTGAGFNGNVISICLQPDGKIIVAGNFTLYDNATANQIVRLDEFGALDPTFNAGAGFNNFNNGDIALLPDGKILAVGSFTSFDTHPCSYVARINTNGSFDNTFQSGTGFNSFGIGDIVFQQDGKILIVGGFSSYAGNNCNGIARLDTSGTYDNTFTGAYGGQAIAIQSDGKILVAANSLNNYLGRLNSDGTVDNTFITGAGFNNNVWALAIQTDGKVLAGGTFTQYDSYFTNRIIRLNNVITGINEITTNNLFSVFPNPSDGKIKINFLKAYQEPFTATLSNVFGEKIKSFKLKDDTSELQLNQPSGIYFMTLRNSKQSFTQKIVLQ